MPNLTKYLNFCFFIVLYSKIGMASFFNLQLLGDLHIVEESYEGHIWNPEEIVSQKDVLFTQKKNIRSYLT